MRKFAIALLLSVKLVQLAGYSGSYNWKSYEEEIADIQASLEQQQKEQQILQQVPKEYRYFFIDFPYQYDWKYLVAIGCVESGWRETAISGLNWNGSRDVGLFQINDRYVHYFSEKYGFAQFDPFNGEHSLKLAAAHLDFLYNSLDNIEDAVVAYNIGLSAFKRGKSPESGKQYLSKVRSHL